MSAIPSSVILMPYVLAGEMTMIEADRMVSEMFLLGQVIPEDPSVFDQWIREGLRRVRSSL